MDQPIISREMITAKARSAHARGAGRDDHGFNLGAPAIETWQAEWDRLNGQLRHLVVEVSPP
jgi:hypothetical protein